MKEFPMDTSVREIWKLFPLRIRGPRISRCHQAPTLLVQSMKGGKVTQNCYKCGELDTITQKEVDDLHLWIACPECNEPMRSTSVDHHGTYGYMCDACQVCIRLADLLPRWDQIQLKATSSGDNATLAMAVV
jgi:phage FluMu protein Com